MEYRAYFFINMYISDIQRGIQTAHCISDIHMKYRYNSDHNVKIINHWAENYKTMIVLNGGYSSHLKELIAIFDNQTELPWDSFYESMEALDGALTCVGIIIPENVYSIAQRFRNNMVPYYNNGTILSKILGEDTLECEDTEINKWLIENLSNYRLA